MEDNKVMRVVVGHTSGLCREIQIDLTDAQSIVVGLNEATNLSGQLIQAQLAQLTQRVETLEKLAKGDKAAAATSRS